MKQPEDALGDVARLRRAIDDSPYDAVIIVSPENLCYAADVHLASQIKIRDRLTAIVWAKGRAPIMVVCVVWEALIRRNSWIDELRTYREFHHAPMDLVADVLRELGVESGHVGYEGEYLAGRYCDQLRSACPGLRLGECDALLARVRMIKTPREVALLQDAFRGTAKALQATFIGARPGESERSMARRLSDHIMLSGAESVTGLVIGAGVNTGMHAGATNYQAQAGDLLKSDCGGLYRGYFSNIGRTAKLGPLTEEDRSIWRRLRDIQHALVDMLRPGRTGCEVFVACAKLHAKADLPFAFGHNGHSVGLMIHERPIIAPNEDILYEAGMVSTVETRVRWPGRIGYHMEDLYLITDGAPVLLSDAFDNKEILVV